MLSASLVVLLLWVGALLGLGVSASGAGTNYAEVFSLPDTDSKRAYDLMEKAFPERAGDTDTVVWKVDEGSVRDGSVRSRIQPALTEIGRMEGVGAVTDPYGAQGAAQISEDGRIAYAQVTFAEQADAVPKELVQDVVDTAQDAARDGLRVELGGQAITRVQEPPTGTAELVGILAAAVVLFVAFGSLFAMLLPIVVAVFGVGTGMFGTQLLSHVTDVPELASLLSTLIGLGVGIDYALFIVTGTGAASCAAPTPEEAAVTALNTSGRAVLFAGGTVCIALRRDAGDEPAVPGRRGHRHHAHRRPERARRRHPAARAARPCSATGCSAAASAAGSRRRAPGPRRRAVSPRAGPPASSAARGPWPPWPWS
ncbi:hypothetical protein GCM10023238_12060 [Streptomyces heliomycini]